MNARHREHLLFAAIVVLVLPWSGPVAAQGAEQSDNSGTNPTTLTRALALNTTYAALRRDRFSSTTTLRYTEPLFDGRWALRFSMPFASTDAIGTTRTGFGDASAKLTWVAHLDQRQGLVFTGEVAAPTASEAALGTGRWVASPGITYAYFVSREVIVAPALIHNMSFGAPDGRGRVNRTDFDLYTVYKPTGVNWWLTSDVTISRDWEARVTPMSWRVALGTNIARLPGGGAVNLSVRPGIGFGRDLPFHWSIELGVSVVGF